MPVIVEEVNEQNLALLDELVAPDYVDRLRQFRDLESYKQYLRTFYKTFPDSHETIEDVIAEGDKIWILVKGEGIHKGEFRGLAPTGKKITWEAVSIWRIADGKVAELQYATTELDFLKELGVIEWKGFPDEVK